MLSACNNQSDISDNKEADYSSLTETIQNNDKIWTKQEIDSMFYRMNENENLEYIDCVLISDKASDRIGAVLFWDPDKKTTNVAFYDKDGYAHQCGVYAKTASDPDFEYLGNGKVQFKLETENGTVYNHTLTISVNENSVNFISADNSD